MRVSSTPGRAAGARSRSASASASVAALRRPAAACARCASTPVSRPRSRASANSRCVDACTPKNSVATSSIWWASSKITASYGGSTCASGQRDLQRQVGEEQVVVDDHQRRGGGAPAHRGDEAALEERAARADARLGRRRDLAPQRRVVGAARAGRRGRRVCDAAANARIRSSSGSATSDRCAVALAEAPAADVVRQALHDGPLERRRSRPA